MADAFPTAQMDQAKGVQGELIASAWLYGLGYHVFRNLGPVGPVDLIAWEPHTGETILIDVKHFSEGCTYGYEDGRVCIPLRATGRDDVHRLIVIGGAVVGFYRSVGRGKGGDFYWPLQCPEVPVTFQPKAKSYRETQGYSGVGRSSNGATWAR